MLSVGPGELAVIFLVALVFLGPRRLPEIARQIGRFTFEIRKTADQLRSTLDDEVREEDRQKRLAEIRTKQAAQQAKWDETKRLAEIAAPAPPEPSAELPPGASDQSAPFVLRPAEGVVARLVPGSTPPPPAGEDEPVTDPGRRSPLEAV